MNDSAKKLTNVISESLVASPRSLWQQRVKTLQWVKLNYTTEAKGRFKVIYRKGRLLHDIFGLGRPTGI
jgi:hypothetical protein